MSVITTAVTKATKLQKDEALWNRYQQLKTDNKMLFPLEGADKLQVSEMELLLASPYSRYMGSNCAEVLHALTEFNQLESIVRNEFAVHEKVGQLKNLKLGKHMGIALDVGGLDLRLFIDKWQHMLAISDDSKATDEVPGSFSIQFFDATGAAIAKMFLRDYSAEAIKQWFALIEQHSTKASQSNSQDLINNLQAHKPNQPWQYKALNEEDVSSLQQQWLDLTDIHQFHFVLKKLEVDRASSYLQAPKDMAVQLQPEAIESLLKLIQQQANPLMIFVGNTGMVQIQTGNVYQIKRLGDWLNILDKAKTNFTLHLKDREVSQLWCVKRPTKDGIVTCIEAFDAYGETIISFFGQRQEGEPEQSYWQQITEAVVAKHSFTAR